MRKTLIKLTAFLLIILLVISAAPVTVFATNVVLQQDDEIGYYYEMPNVGNLLELNLADRSDGFTFKLYDDGGAADDYSNNCNNALIITAPKDYVFKISGSGATESVSYDYLTVYDGDTSKMLGNGRFGGTYTWRVKPLNILYGDVNGDGVVSIRDATLVQMYLAQMVEFDAAQLLAADADGNGTVDINDVTRIQQYLVGMIDSLR